MYSVLEICGNSGWNFFVGLRHYLLFKQTGRRESDSMVDRGMKENSIAYRGNCLKFASNKPEDIRIECGRVEDCTEKD